MLVIVGFMNKMYVSRRSCSN